ncbi:MAG: RIP metalloprotease RseP [Flavobacteriales bacterium]
MTFLTYILSFLTLISIIVFIHELGHFFFARLFGVRVLDFSIGFGRSIKCWQTKNNTTFNLRILPFGGYVKMHGEEPIDKSLESDSYSSKKYYQKLLITLGGPLFNFFLALVIFFSINLYGVYKISPIIGDVLPNSDAQILGLQKNDEILEIDNTKISSYSDAQVALSKRLGDTGTISLEIKRGENFSTHKFEIKNWLNTEQPSNFLLILGIVPPLEPIIGAVIKSSPAEKGGLVAGDKIIQINNKNISSWSEIKKLVNDSDGKEMQITVLRNNKKIDLQIKPVLYEDSFNWQMGITSSYILKSDLRKFTRYGFLKSFTNSFEQTYEVIQSSILFIGKMVSGSISPKNLGGPVMIGQYAGQSVIHGGLYSFIYLIAFISISLGIVNLLPLPVLDGGQALILTIEKLIKRDLPDWLLDFFYKIGTVIILFIFIFVFYNDLSRILGL